MTDELCEIGVDGSPGASKTLTACTAPEAGVSHPLPPCEGEMTEMEGEEDGRSTGNGNPRLRGGSDCGEDNLATPLTPSPDTDTAAKKCPCGSHPFAFNFEPGDGEITCAWCGRNMN